MPAPQQSQNPIYKDTSNIPRPQIDRFLHDPRDSAGYALARALKTVGGVLGKKAQENQKQLDAYNEDIQVANAQLGLEDINSAQSKGNGLDILTGGYDENAHEAKRGQIAGVNFGGELRDKYLQDEVYKNDDPEAYKKWLDENLAGGIAAAKAKGPSYFRAYMKELGNSVEKMSKQAAGHVENIIERETQTAWKQKIRDAREADKKGLNRRQSNAFLKELTGVAGGEDIGALVTHAIKGHEGFKTTAYWDVNAWRTGYGSDTYTTADGKVHKVHKNTVITRADAERDLARRLARDFMPKVIEVTGKEGWNGMNANTKAALASIAYNYGEIPKRIRGAVRSGDPKKIAAAIRTLGGDNKGINRKRRNREADMVLKGGPVLPKVKTGDERDISGAQALRDAGSVSWLSGAITDEDFAKKLGVPVEKIDELRVHLDKNAPLRKYLSWTPPKKKDGPDVLDTTRPPETLLDESAALPEQAGDYGVSDKAHRDALTEVAIEEIEAGTLVDPEAIELEIKQAKLNKDQAQRIRDAAELAQLGRDAEARAAKSEQLTMLDKIIRGEGDINELKTAAPGVYRRLMEMQQPALDPQLAERQQDFGQDYLFELNANDPDYVENVQKDFISGKIDKETYVAAMEWFDDEVAARPVVKNPTVAKTMELYERGMIPEVRKVFRDQVKAAIAVLRKHNNGEKPPVPEVLEVVKQMAEAVGPAAETAVTERLARPEYNLGN